MNEELKTERALVKDSANLMLNGYNEMYEYLKEKEDTRGIELYGNLMVRIAMLLDNLCNLHDKKIALMEKKNGNNG